MEPEFPNAETVVIVGQPNAFEILGNVQGSLRRAGVSKEIIDGFLAEAMSGNYDYLCSVAESYVNIEWV